MEMSNCITNKIISCSNGDLGIARAYVDNVFSLSLKFVINIHEKQYANKIICIFDNKKRTVKTVSQL